MTTLTQKITTRHMNIFFKAQANEWEPDFSESFEHLLNEAELFILNTTDEDAYQWEYCNVSGHGSSQNISWSDGRDLDFSATGEITDWSRKRFVDHDGEKEVWLAHELVVDTDGSVVQLYDKRQPDELELVHETFELI